ncbi:M12 family metallo-peptidase [uncultured Aquimarina sp.]|uniref:M12 family metallo-peptidase n=1 Tax=uncultured Aquimarina sp. TaxID=575652 RepID=UPI0026166E8E|nr:M12 family metallo-peptidase [uncultured Aquimarina sp.]
MKGIFTLFVMLSITTSFFAQNHNPKTRVQNAKSSGTFFKTVSLLNLKTEKSNTTLPKEFKNYSILSINTEFNKKMISSSPEAINLMLPGKKSSMLLELVKTNIKTDDFYITEMPSKKVISPEKNIVHYQGIVKNSPNSIAAISIYDGEISGIISVEGSQSDLVLGKLDNSTDHILYEDKDISHLNDFICQITDVHQKSGNNDTVDNEPPASNQVKCPEIFFDIANDVVRDKGGSQSAANFVEAMFNQVAILYANEDIKIKLSGLTSWTTSNPFNSLDSYRNYRNQNGFNGDLAHFVTYNYSGGVAWLNALCGSYRYGLTGINRSYQNVPTYSWNISTIAHELGHNFGSNHTHSCVWNGNNTAIDGCYSTEGSCGRPGIPSNGGTIMSYCHLTNAGTNLRKGFGPQPGDLIRSNIRRANCVGSCDSDGDNGGDGDQVDCTGIDAWSGNVSYVAGDQVTYQGRLFERTTNNSWIDLGECISDPCSRAIPWTDNTDYKPGDVVIYQGNVWLRTESNDWELLNCDINTNDPCFGIDPWSENTNYSSGDQVVYQGKAFEWNGSEWIEIATCAEDPSTNQTVEKPEISSIDEILIYPNPAKGFITLEIKRPKNNLIKININSLQGRNIFSKTIQQKSSIQHLKEIINIDTINTGIYFIQIISGGEITTKKLEVQ